MFLGIDLGTSAVKAVLVGSNGEVLDQCSVETPVHRPRPGWSEQAPEDWWSAAQRAVATLAGSRRGGLEGLEAIGLSGQMHGATLLDSADRPVRPAILWNDGRSASQCTELERLVPDARAVTGNLAMPGFTAPKLLWVREHEPENFRATRRVLLPKDYLRLQLTGEFASDLSDASGTYWLDVGRREWSDALIGACGLTRDAMPTLFEGTEVTGRLRAEVAAGWGCGRVPVVGGAGDQAAGAVGAGVIAPGEASLSLGTSGVYFVAGEAFQPNPDRAVHAFCHCLPDRWHQMSVLLSAASCLSWVARATGAADEAALLSEIEHAGQPRGRLLFLPYLSGERTPHNDPAARGVFFGLDHEVDRAALGRAVLEGVALAFADAQEVLLEAGAAIGAVSVIGGGARSRLWGRILASALERPLVYRESGEVGPALGAARLARIGVSGEAPADVCEAPPVDFVVEPDPEWTAHARDQLPRFRRLYRDLRESFEEESP